MAKINPLNEPLKLRTTAAWSGFRAVETIPICFGKTWVTPVQKNPQRTRWVVCDRAIEGVDKVYIDDELYKRWEWRNTADETGHPIAEVLLGEELEEGQTIKVQLRGITGSDSGLIVNPADWLWTILNDYIGVPVQLSELSVFRHETFRDRLEIHGVLSDSSSTAFSVITQVVSSIGAVWSPNMPGYASLYPVSSKPSNSAYYAEIDITNSQQHSAVHNSQDIYSIVQVLYDYNFAESEYNGTLELRADDVFRKLGAKRFTVDAKYTASAYEAFSIGKRFIEQKARPQWSGSALYFPETGERIPPGVWATINHPIQIVSGGVFLTDSQVNPIDMSTSVSFDSPVGSVPRFVVSQQNVRFDRLGIEILVEKDEDVYEVLILDSNNNPLPGAQVQIGSKVSITNANGIAKFTGLDPGTYTMTVTANGQPVLTNPNFVVS